MVKSVVGEEAQLKSFEDRLSQSGSPSEVGLVIGKLSSALDRGFVFNLVPTPNNDAEEPASSLVDASRDDKKKGGSKGKSQAESSSLVIDQDWVTEHARQVSRMLVGGMKVVGLYVWVSDNSFKNSTLALCQTVKGVAEAACSLGTNLDEGLIIHISYSPRRWTCRNCNLTSNITSSSLKPCDFKMGRVLSSFRTFRCMYNFDLRLPIFCEVTSDRKTLIDFLCYGISLHAKELACAKAVIDGNLVIEDEPCVSDGLHEVELLLPFMSGIADGACSQKEVVGVLLVSGSLCSFAFVNSKEMMSRAIADIKEDIIKSLQTRLDIFCDEADGNMGPASNEISAEKPISQLVLQSLRKPCSISFPRRVFVPWLAGTYICDYLQPSESLEALKEHCVELMSIEVPADTSRILQPETEAPTLAVKTFWDVAVPPSKQPTSNSPSSNLSRTNRTESGSNSAFVKSADYNVIAAVLILLLSMLAAWLLLPIRR